MMKTISKFLFFTFLGLLTFAATDSYAQSTNDNASQDVEIKDAWSYLDKGRISTDDYAKFKKNFGENKGSMACGPRRCDAHNQTCMVKSEYLSIGKERRAAKNRTEEDLRNAGQALDRQDRWFGKGRHLLTYVCVANKEVGDYQKSGYDIYDTSSNIEDKKKKNLKKDTCFSDAKDSTVKYCVKIIGNEVEVRAAKGNNGGCAVIPVAWYNNRKCVFCSLMGGIFATADHITRTSQEALAYSFAIVLALGLLIWIAMKTVSFVSSLTKQDAPKFITELIKQSYKFIIAFVILSNYNATFDVIIKPLLNAGLEFGSGFVSVQSIEQRFKQYYPENGPKGISVLKKESAAENFPNKDYTQNRDNKYFDFETYVAMENFAYNVNLNYSLLQTVGSSLFCRGWRYALGVSGEGLEFGLGFSCMIYGTMLSAFGFLLCLAFIFYLLDAVVQLGIVGGLLPFLIASWPFKMTSKYTSTGFKMFLNSVFTFMMMGFVVKVTILLIDNAMGSAAVANEADNLAKFEQSGLMNLANAIDKVDTDSLRTMVNVFSVGFCVFIFASIMGFLLLSKVSELTNKFASGGMKGSASSIATMAASKIKGMAGKVMAPTAKALDKKAKQFTAGAAKAAVGLATLKPVRNAIAKRNRAARIKGSRPSGEATLGGSK